MTTVGGASTTITSPPGGGVTVLDAPLTSTNGTEITGIEGITTGTVLLGTFTDANQASTVADFTTGTGTVSGRQLGRRVSSTNSDRRQPDLCGLARWRHLDRQRGSHLR